MALQQIDLVSENNRMADSIVNCLEPSLACGWCTTSCTRMGEEDMTRCMELCRDVADLAMLHTRLMARYPDYSCNLAEICAELYEACAYECEQLDAGNCQRNSDALRECSDFCRNMASV